MDKPRCPLCGQSCAVETFDEGYKRLIRSLRGNNRYVCSHCAITWRQRTPLDWQDMKKKPHTEDATAKPIKQVLKGVR